MFAKIVLVVLLGIYVFKNKKIKCLIWKVLIYNINHILWDKITLMDYSEIKLGYMQKPDISRMNLLI